MPVRKFLLFSLLFLFSWSVFAQNSDQSVTGKPDEEAVRQKQERERKLLDEIMADAKNLRLPENRAYVFARVGSALWPTDEKAARKLFQEAAAELMAAQNDIQNEKFAVRQQFQALFYGQTPRQDVINLVAARDAALALEYLEKSRPPVIAQAMQGLQEESYYSTVRQYAANEIMIEQRLLTLAVEQNPQNFISKLRESIKRGISYETLNILAKVHAKDPEAAVKLAEEIVESFLTLDFSKNSQTAEAAGYFVNTFVRDRAPDDKSLTIPEELLRRLLAKMSDDWLKSKNGQFYGYGNSARALEKFFPERAAALKKIIQARNTNNQNQNQSEESARYNKLMASETPPETMVAQAGKLPASMRNEIYRSAAMKYANNGNVAEAERILQTNISDEQSESYLMQFYLNRSYQLSGDGKFEEAANYINLIADENQRINALINLGNAAYSRNQKENRPLAEGFLNQARALIADPPESQNDLNSLSYLATIYVNFDANESFRLMESMLPSVSELIQATLVLMKYRTYGGMRQGEVQMLGGNNFGLYNLDNLLRALKVKDFERTVQFVDGFNRPETRIWLRIQLIDENPQPANLPISSRRSLRFRG